MDLNFKKKKKEDNFDRLKVAVKIDPKIIPHRKLLIKQKIILKGLKLRLK